MNILRPWNAVWTLLAALAFFVLMIPSPADGAKVAVGPDNPRAYGAWGSDPRKGAGNGVTLEPFNTKQPEMSKQFACVFKGQPLSENVIQAASAIGQMAYLLNGGRVDGNSVGGGADTNYNDAGTIALWSKPNYGLAEGDISSVNTLIKREEDWLQKNVLKLYETGEEAADAYIEDLSGGGGGGNQDDSEEEGVNVTDKDALKKSFKNRAKKISAWSLYSNRQFQGSTNDESTYLKQAGEDVNNGKKNDRMAWSEDKDGSNIWLYMDKGNYRKKDPSEMKEGFPLTVNEGGDVARILNGNAKNMADIFHEDLPDGCIPATFQAPGGNGGIGDLFSNPTAFFTALIFSPIIDISNSIYQQYSSDAWGKLFFTAHTERGDLVWDLDTECLAIKPPPGRATSSEKQAYKQSRKAQGDQCKNNKPLGFSKKNIKDNVKDRPLYLDLANLIAWLITGTYFVILFSAAVLFIYRGNKSQKFNLMKVAPRILLSMLLAIAAPFLIGAIISASNWATTGIFDMLGEEGSPITAMNMMLSQAGDMMGVSDTANVAVTAIVALIALGTTLVFFAGVLIKQLALIFIIILAPIAIFCLIVDSWKKQFMRWLKALLILCLLPVVMATVLMIAVLMNPLMAGNVNEALSIIMLIATLFAMGWIFKTGLSIAIRGKNTNFLGGIVTAAGAGLQGAAPILNAAVPGAGVALGVAGQGLRAGGQKLNKGDVGDKIAGALVPEGRASGGASGSGVLQRFGRSVTHGVHIGQGRRGVFGRTGRYGRAGRRFDEDGEGGENREEKTGSRQSPAARTYRRMKGSMSRAKNHLSPSRKIRSLRDNRARRREELGKEGWDWARPMATLPLWRKASLDKKQATAEAGISGLEEEDMPKHLLGEARKHHATDSVDAATAEKLSEIASARERQFEQNFNKEIRATQKAKIKTKLENGEISEKQAWREMTNIDSRDYARETRDFMDGRGGSGEFADNYKKDQAATYARIQEETAKANPSGKGLVAGSSSINKHRGGGATVRTYDAAGHAKKVAQDKEVASQGAETESSIILPENFHNK